MMPYPKKAITVIKVSILMLLLYETNVHRRPPLSRGGMRNRENCAAVPIQERRARVLALCRSYRPQATLVASNTSENRARGACLGLSRIVRNCGRRIPDC